MTDPPDSPRESRLDAASKSVLQVIAIVGLAGICFMILHKGYSDVTALARTHGGDFWPALLRYLFRNLAGG